MIIRSHYTPITQLPLHKFADGARNSLIYMETASPKRKNRRFGVELGSTVSLQWPASAAAECGAWLREWLR